MRRRFLVAALVLALALLASCSGSDDESTSTTETTAQDGANTGGTPSDNTAGEDADPPAEVIDGCSIFERSDAEALFGRPVALADDEDLAYPDCTFDTTDSPLQRVFVYGTPSDDASLQRQAELFGQGFADGDVEVEAVDGVGETAFSAPGVLAFRADGIGLVIVAGSSEMQPDLSALTDLAETLIERV